MPQSGAEVTRGYRITATCLAESEASIRMLNLKQIAASTVRLRRLESEDLAPPEGAVARVALSGKVRASGDAAETLETIVGRLSIEPAVTRAAWAEEGEEQD